MQKGIKGTFWDDGHELCIYQGGVYKDKCLFKTLWSCTPNIGAFYFMNFIP